MASPSRDRLVWVISGTHGVGKTTVSRELATRFDRSIHLASDLLRLMIVRARAEGLVEHWRPEAHCSDNETQRQLVLRYENCALLARSHFEAGVHAGDR